MQTVGEIIKGSAWSTYKYYRDNTLYYCTDNGFIFPIPIDDAGGATFNHTEKTIHLMRWIRKFHGTLQQKDPVYG